MYNSFAYVYDVFMKGTPYEKWAENMNRLFKHYKTKPKLILELGCGTGNVTVPMAKRGYEMIGVDLSVDMLNVAREKTLKENLDILYINQDMRAFELYGTVDACISLCDSMNYILTKKDLTTVFKRVRNYLNPGGYFIFDLNTEYMFKLMNARVSFGEARKNSAFVCETAYNSKLKIMEYNVNVFYDSNNNGCYNRFCESHYERAYKINEIMQCIKKSGLIFMGAFDENLKEIKKVSKRVYIVCKKPRKQL